MIDVLYAGVPEDMAEKAAQTIENQSAASFTTPVTYHASSIKVPKIFIACEAYKAIPIDLQLTMAKAAEADVISFPSGHFPHIFEAETKKIVKIVEKAAAS